MPLPSDTASKSKKLFPAAAATAPLSLFTPAAPDILLLLFCLAVRIPTGPSARRTPPDNERHRDEAIGSEQLPPTPSLSHFIMAFIFRQQITMFFAFLVKLILQ